MTKIIEVKREMFGNFECPFYDGDTGVCSALWPEDVCCKMPKECPLFDGEIIVRIKEAVKGG